MRFCAWLLKTAGWRIDITVPDFNKVIICVAPHTSNWDFILGKLAYCAIGRKAGFMMKSSWFFFPLGLIFKGIGGVPVHRSGKGPSLVEQMVKRFKSSTNLALAITPEGTRSRTNNWHTGFLRIAYETKVPIVLGAIDYRQKVVSINTIFEPTGNIETDMIAVKTFYKNFIGRHPEQFDASISSQQ